MSVSAKVIADSINIYGNRVTSLQVTLHRIVLAEVNTHRVFSRSYRSSRAVPVHRLLDEVRANPAMPVYWGKNQSGMQAAEELTGDERTGAEEAWRVAAISAVNMAEVMGDFGLHKQIANRVLEPFLYTHGIITSTEWDNFFKLRLAPEAQPEMRVLAEAMSVALNNSTPCELAVDDWHLPYIDRDDVLAVEKLSGPIDENLRRISAARCARVSYKVFDADRKPYIDEDLDLASRLVANGHWGPFEHQATPDDQHEMVDDDLVRWQRPDLHGNLVGFCQYRKMLEETHAI